jgi:hypothetical protein
MDISLAPITSASGTRTFILNFDKLGRAVLRKVGNHTPNASQLANVKEALNLWANSIQNEELQLWTKKDWIIPLVAGQKRYHLDPGIIDAAEFMFRKEGTDRAIATMTDEDYSRISQKDEAAEPNRVYMDWQLEHPYANLWPVWNGDTGFVLGTDGNSYLCRRNHTSDATTKPITGASYLTYWEQIDSIAATDAWAGATAYYSGVVRFMAVMRAMDVTESTDNPDAPVKWARAIVWNVALEMAPEYGLQKWERDDIKVMAKISLDNALAGDQESADLRIYPRMR